MAGPVPIPTLARRTVLCTAGQYSVRSHPYGGGVMQARISAFQILYAIHSVFLRICAGGRGGSGRTVPGQGGGGVGQLLGQARPLNLPPSQALRVVLLVLVYNWAPLAPIGSLGWYL